MESRELDLWMSQDYGNVGWPAMRREQEQCGAVSGQGRWVIGRDGWVEEAEDRESVIRGMGWDGLQQKPDRYPLWDVGGRRHETRRSDAGHEYR